MLVIMELSDSTASIAVRYFKCSISCNLEKNDADALKILIETRLKNSKEEFKNL